MDLIQQRCVFLWDAIAVCKTGHCIFCDSQGKAVADNVGTAASGKAAKNKCRQYRQYMNRRGVLRYMLFL